MTLSLKTSLTDLRSSRLLVRWSTHPWVRGDLVSSVLEEGADQELVLDVRQGPVPLMLSHQPPGVERRTPRQ